MVLCFILINIWFSIFSWTGIFYFRLWPVIENSNKIVNCFLTEYLIVYAFLNASLPIDFCPLRPIMNGECSVDCDYFTYSWYNVPSTVKKQFSWNVGMQQNFSIHMLVKKKQMISHRFNASLWWLLSCDNVSVHPFLRKNFFLLKIDREFYLDQQR